MKIKCKTSFKTMIKKAGKNKEKNSEISFQQASRENIVAKTERS